MTWTPDKMITEERAAAVAVRLFPDEHHNGSDCRNEIGREGQPCRICAAKATAWAERVKQVRNAMLVAFGHRPMPEEPS